MKKIFPYKCLWQASLLTRKVGKDAVPIDISKFKAIKGNIGLHGYRRVRRESKADVRAYRKDTYGITFVFINFQEHAIEARTETWAGLMALCSEFDLVPYRTA